MPLLVNYLFKHKQLNIKLLLFREKLFTYFDKCVDLQNLIDLPSKWVLLLLELWEVAGKA